MNDLPLLPRLYCIVAAAAPTALVFQRGPGRRWGLHRLDLSSGNLEQGAAFKGTLYPRRCDLSPDGSLLSYFALKGGNGEFMGQRGVKTYSAVSKAPWLFALAAWPESGTWTRGAHFEANSGAAVRGTSVMGPALLGDINPLATNYRLTLQKTAAQQYATERRRGWVEDADCPARGANDVWDERRNVVLTKLRPAGRHSARLIIRDSGRQAGGIEGRCPNYSIEQRKSLVELENVTWADWDPYGRLLVATRDSRLQIRDADSPALKVVREHVLVEPVPNQPAPAWAQRW
jgi:hypothetical protein